VQKLTPFLWRAFLVGSACRIVFIVVAAFFAILAGQVNSYAYPNIYYPLENIAGICFIVATLDYFIFSIVSNSAPPWALLEVPITLMVYIVLAPIYSTLLGIPVSGVIYVIRSWCPRLGKIHRGGSKL